MGVFLSSLPKILVLCLQGNIFVSSLPGFITVRRGLSNPKNETTAPVTNCNSHFSGPQIPQRLVCEYEGRAGVGMEISPAEKAVRENRGDKMSLQVTPNSPSLSLEWAGRAGALSIRSSRSLSARLFGGVKDARTAQACVDSSQSTQILAQFGSCPR